MTPGSGAACLASLYSKAPYSGIAFNEKHETWLRDLLQRMFVSMVISNDVVADAGLVKTLPHISTARRKLRSSCFQSSRLPLATASLAMTTATPKSDLPHPKGTSATKGG